MKQMVNNKWTYLHFRASYLQGSRGMRKKKKEKKQTQIFICIFLGLYTCPVMISYLKYVSVCLQFSKNGAYMFPIQSTASNTKRERKVQSVDQTSNISKSDLIPEPTDSKAHESSSMMMTFIQVQPHFPVNTGSKFLFPQDFRSK